MKFVTFEKSDRTVRSGVLLDSDLVIDMHEATNGKLPGNMIDFLEQSESNLTLTKGLLQLSYGDKGAYPLNQVRLIAPLPNPKSFRDFYAFEQHVKSARANRGLKMIPEWYQIPVFYFSNHLAIAGPEEEIIKPVECKWLDFELEVSCIIGKQGRNIPAEEAEDYIFGYCILNDWSARDLQRQEMKVGLGPAKGKDFATSLGPWVITKDEMDPLRSGKGFDISMRARINGSLLSEGNMKDIYYSFGEMIERASAGVTLYPGEIIGSGTVGTGCILELGTEVHRWLQPGDEVELEIDKLGVLRNSIIEVR
ncbi:2-keto-4-pentenoate hydratase/2-oxohepta-3-ene-1,7-dioic acid hydratase in catechol pathway [Bacillus niacini]|uniref:2-keto-4-pentenoate hydratase/2-oxohepta-3-ene-1,7-dioic acid hydratase in catechol pathway n=1 Tax=Neobacillus niacini TaxID=86668 RepID=A0A852T9H9_9BACI|nr:fumarylacetoacetate hydrolase family protein [Neobacillus niacini]NYE04549.1 2-keto-4-pentenoate hydratase/2-oxohepta-3-ene-1,7-dioic acid hydratase in catechol pathway [Neobacillus niacini]